MFHSKPFGILKSFMYMKITMVYIKNHENHYGLYSPYLTWCYDRYCIFLYLTWCTIYFLSSSFCDLRIYDVKRHFVCIVLTYHIMVFRNFEMKCGIWKCELLLSKIWPHVHCCCIDHIQPHTACHRRNKSLSTVKTLLLYFFQ